MSHVNLSKLGQSVSYQSNYDPKLLFRITRNKYPKSEKAPYSAQIGFDIWNCYEISWLNHQGQPQQRLGRISYAANSPFIVESKSLKLYLNSYNQTKFLQDTEINQRISEDLSTLLETPVEVKLFPLNMANASFFPASLPGFCLDEISIDFDFTGNDSVNKDYLKLDSNGPTILTQTAVPRNDVSELLYSHALRSNCPVTNQPDWGTLAIYYQGPAIDKANLLRYIISYRQHQGFHEDCVERIFRDIAECCQPRELLVQAFYTRRGGIDICPWRGSSEYVVDKLINPRLIRQ